MHAIELTEHVTLFGTFPQIKLEKKNVNTSHSALWSNNAVHIFTHIAAEVSCVINPAPQ